MSDETLAQSPVQTEAMKNLIDPQKVSEDLLDALAGEVRTLKMRLAIAEQSAVVNAKEGTLRDTFASMIVGGLISREPISYVRDLVEDGSVYGLADAMMMARTKKP